MANIEIDWAITAPISVYDEGNDLGFNLRKFDQQKEEVQLAMKKATVDRVMAKIRKVWNDGYDDSPPAGKSFSQIRNGVYVISIRGGFAVDYSNCCSEVMNIGRGVFANRLRSHLQNWIFDMSRSLRDVPFRFYMASVGNKKSYTAYRDFEHFLLEHLPQSSGRSP